MADDKQETRRAERVITRRDFLVSNAAAVAIGVAGGSTFASTSSALLRSNDIALPGNIVHG